MAQSGQGTSTNIGDQIIAHVANSDVMIHFELFGVDLSITKHVIMLWIAAGLLITGALYATRKYRKEERPVLSGFSNAFEYVVDFVRTGILIPTVGKDHVLKWGPLVLSFFFLILTMNFLGLMPIFYPCCSANNKEPPNDSDRNGREYSRNSWRIICS